MSPRRIPRYIRITHADVAGYEVEQRQREREVERAAREAQERVQAERKERDAWATLEQVPPKYRTRGVVSYDPTPERLGRLREKFSCGCDKPEHGHRSPFADIIVPTELTFIDPAEEAAKLAARVNRARTQTPPAAPGGGYHPTPAGGPTPGRRMRR